MKLATIKKSYFIYMFVSLLFGGFIGFSLINGSLDLGMIMKIYFLGLSLVLIVSIPLGLSWWKQIDEAAREAHKTAWFWGGSIGMTISCFVAALNLFFDGAIMSIIASALNISDIHKFGFELGMFNVMSFMGLGYMVHWAIWWKKHGA